MIMSNCNCFPKRIFIKIFKDFSTVKKNDLDLFFTEKDFKVKNIYDTIFEEIDDYFVYDLILKDVISLKKKQSTHEVIEIQLKTKKDLKLRGLCNLFYDNGDFIGAIEITQQPIVILTLEDKENKSFAVNFDELNMPAFKINKYESRKSKPLR